MTGAHGGPVPGGLGPALPLAPGDPSPRAPKYAAAVASPDVINDLLRRTGSNAPDLLPLDIGLALRSVGSDHAVVYLVDYEQTSLEPVVMAASLASELPPPLRVDGTMAGRCFQIQQVVTAERDGSTRMWIPVRERADRLGVLEVDLPAGGDELADVWEELGRVVGHIVHTAARYTDAVESVRRRKPMSLSAELQWDLLVPPLTFETPDVAVTGLLEPAYEVAGDGFDYSINGPVLDIVILDAMGHGLRSTLASALTLSAARHSRRAGRDLVGTASAVDAALAEHFDGESFVTGHLGRLDVENGRFRWINAGHPPPLLARGLKVVGELRAEPCLPLGLGIRLGEVGECQLEPADTLVFYSDGAVEARPDGGSHFGMERLAERIEQHLAAGRRPAEMLRRLVVDVRSHRRAELKDDVTLVALTWRPPRL